MQTGHLPQTYTQNPPDKTGKLGWKPIARFSIVVLLPITLFLIAGRWDWWQGWAYIAVYILSSVFSRVLVAMKNPDLIRERAQYTDVSGVKSWDKKITPFVIYLPLVAMVVAALDLRLGWLPELPLWLQLLGLAGMILGIAFSTWAMVVNRFFSAVVRIQTDRGQSVVSTRPYRIVRHPGYAGGIVTDLGFPLLLGSAWALIPILITIGMYVLRTALEDRTLRAELPGYKEYAARVQYRLLPGVW